MSILLPDESHCKTDLGLILYAQRPSYTFAAEVVDNREVSGLFGYVEYDVVISATSLDKIVNETRRFKTQTRFKEVHKLFTTLSTIHKQLYLKDHVPNFPGTVMWGSAAPEIIVERRKAIGLFVNFVVNNEVLCKTRAFQTFLESFVELKEHSNSTTAVEVKPGDIPEGPLSPDLFLPSSAEAQSEPEGAPAPIEELRESEDS